MDKGSTDPGADQYGDSGEYTVRAQYNPATLQIDQNVPWKKPEASNKTNNASTGEAAGGSGGGASAASDDGLSVEFTGAEGRTMTVELLFDGFEKTDDRKVDVAKCVAVLERLAAVRTPGSGKDAERRPHQCVVAWPGVLDRFTCVIENLSTKYTMFDRNGTPLRATCTVKLKEAHVVDKKGK